MEHARNMNRRTDPVGGLQAGLARAFSSGRDTLLIAYSLWAVAGLVGAHRFYLRAYISGGVQAGLMTVCFPLAFAAATADATTGVKLGLLLQTLIGGWGLLAAVLWLMADLFLIPRIARRRRRADPAQKRQGEAPQDTARDADTADRFAA